MSFTFIFILIFVLNNMITRRRRGRVVKGTTPQTRLAVSIYKMLSVFSTTKRTRKENIEKRREREKNEEREEDLSSSSSSSSCQKGRKDKEKTCARVDSTH